MVMPEKRTVIMESENKEGAKKMSYNFKETMNKPERLAAWTQNVRRMRRNNRS